MKSKETENRESATDRANRQLATFLLMRRYVTKNISTDDSERGLTDREQELISKLNAQTEKLHRLHQQSDED